MSNYDVIVVGAGIPGLYAARELCRGGKRVLLVESEKTPGEPNYSTAGTPVETIAAFGLPAEGIAETVTRFLFATKNHEAVKESATPVSYVLDFRKMKQLLAAEVAALGGTCLWGVHAGAFEVAGASAAGGQPGARTNAGAYTLHTSQGDFTAEYLIDASGATGHLAVQAGLRAARPAPLSVGVEYIVATDSPRFAKFQKTLAIYLDTQLCPFGYAWVFAQGGNTYKVGLAEYYLNPKRGLPSLDERLDAFLAWLTQSDACQTVEKHGGSKFITTNFHHVYAGKLAAIGDTIGAINPLYGEGIRHGLYSAKFAVEAILAGDLHQYQTAWEKYLGKKWRKTEFEAHVLYDKAGAATQNFYETIVRQTEKYGTPESIINSGYTYTSQSFFTHPGQRLEILLAAARVML